MKLRWHVGVVESKLLGALLVKLLEVLAEVTEDPKFRPSLSTIFWQGLPKVTGFCIVLCTVTLILSNHCTLCLPNYRLVHN